ncbi:MAG TPA: glycerol kinase GlpK [Candidatus Binatia bacterium]|nr:glycerol kinase GlpK [Candidatus Binatia bacterium]
MAPRFVLALDQGTTSSRAILFDHDGRPVSIATRELPQLYPEPGNVAHDPEAIWYSQLAAAREALTTAGAGAADIAAIGVTNQRETTIVWERETGTPVADAIVWQSRVTAPYCDELRAKGLEPLVRERTGLPIDAYFSGPKIRHILRSEAGLQARAEKGELAFGTVDSFLLWRLTGGRVHATDVSNASRTMLFDIHDLRWDDELLAEMEVPRVMLPEVRASSEILGETEPDLFGRPIPIAGMAGDQQAATFGQACLDPGQAKNTYGTGAFLLLVTGERPVASANGLLTTVAWRIGPDGPVVYALEGSVFVAGAAIQWLRDGLRAVAHSGDVERLASRAEDTGGVYLVPAFVGLGAPYWDPYARGLLIGITRGTGLPEIARATLDSLAYQVHDLVSAMAGDAGELDVLRVDGGASINDSLLQFQADLLGVPVERPIVVETTAWGAAALAGLAVGFWSSPAELADLRRVDRRFDPAMDAGRRDDLLAGWRRAVERSRDWARPDAPGGAASP